MPDDSLNDWLTKTQAAAFLQVSEKTIERLASKGDLHRATRKRQGARPLPVYDPDDLQKVKDSQTTTPAVVPEAAPTQTKALAPRLDFPSFLQALSETPRDVPLQDKLFLNLKEAARYSGLPLSLIRRLIKENKLPAIKAGGWRIKRADLEQLDLRHLRDVSDKPV